MNTQDFEHLRQLIETALSELGMPEALWSCIKVESSGQGRHQAQLPPSQVIAFWYADRNEIELHSLNGGLLKTIPIRGGTAGLGEAA